MVGDFSTKVTFELQVTRNIVFSIFLLSVAASSWLVKPLNEWLGIFFSFFCLDVLLIPCCFFCLILGLIWWIIDWKVKLSWIFLFWFFFVFDRVGLVYFFESLFVSEFGQINGFYKGYLLAIDISFIWIVPWLGHINLFDNKEISGDLLRMSEYFYNNQSLDDFFSVISLIFSFQS